MFVYVFFWVSKGEMITKELPDCSPIDIRIRYSRGKQSKSADRRIYRSLDQHVASHQPHRQQDISGRRGHHNGIAWKQQPQQPLTNRNRRGGGTRNHYHQHRGGERSSYREGDTRANTKSKPMNHHQQQQAKKVKSAYDGIGVNQAFVFFHVTCCFPSTSLCSFPSSYLSRFSSLHSFCCFALFPSIG
jgi:hypothetical protein